MLFEDYSKQASKREVKRALLDLHACQLIRFAYQNCTKFDFFPQHVLTFAVNEAVEENVQKSDNLPRYPAQEKRTRDEARLNFIFTRIIKKLIAKQKNFMTKYLLLSDKIK